MIPVFIAATLSDRHHIPVIIVFTVYDDPSETGQIAFIHLQHQ